MQSNLKPGIGEPCAGQVSATPNPSDFVKVNESNWVENFGLVDPIGSIKCWMYQMTEQT